MIPRASHIQGPAHLSAWVAGLLTPLARFAFVGPVPLFLIDGNVRGCGKGLLAEVAALIITGRRFPVTSYTADREELRKRITTLALEGATVVLLDNLSGPVGNDVLDAALTSTRWKDRILGGNRAYDGPLNVTWYGTGNNVQLRADTSRRTCHLRLESSEERPELRQGFFHENLRAHVLQHRGELLSAALTILRHFLAAGCPSQGIPAWGSFEEWSDLVRGAVVFAGFVDPGETRLELQETADRDAVAMRAVIEVIRSLDPPGHGVTAREIVARVTDRYTPGHLADSAEILQEFCEGSLNANKLGYQLRRFKRRNFGGRMIDSRPGAAGVVRWFVAQVGGPTESPGTVDTGLLNDGSGIADTCSHSAPYATDRNGTHRAAEPRAGGGDGWDSGDASAHAEIPSGTPELGVLPGRRFRDDSARGERP